MNATKIREAQKKALKNSGITYDELGKRTGMTKSGAWNLVNNNNVGVNTNTIEKFCKALNIPVKDFINSVI